MKKKARAPGSETPDERYDRMAQKYKADGLPNWDERAFAEAYSQPYQAELLQDELDTLKNRKRILGIFEKYRLKGGDPERLKELLLLLTPSLPTIPNYNFPAIGQELKRKLTACEAAHAGLLPLLVERKEGKVKRKKDEWKLYGAPQSGPMKKLREAVMSANEAIKKFRRSSPEAMFAFLRAHGFTRPKGRRPGPTRQSLVMASIELEFRRRLGTPHLREILDLIEDVDPEVFSNVDNKLEALRQRILSVPDKDVEAFSSRFLD